MVGFGGFDIEGVMGLLFAFVRVMEMLLERCLSAERQSLYNLLVCIVYNF
jgi:hypothetical protein